MKKLLALFLLSALVFSLLTACDNSTQTDVEKDETQTEESENEYRDFYEQEFWAAYSIGTASYNWFWPEPNTAEQERTRKNSERVQELLNCVLKEEGFQGMTANTWAQRMAIGDYQFSWTLTQADAIPLSVFYDAGFIQSWNGISNVDLNDHEKWGSPRVQQMATFGGEVYAAMGNDGTGHFGRIFYNKILAQELNTSVLPQDLYEQNNWTWDSFEDYLASVTVNEPDRKVYGMSIYRDETQLAYCALFTNGGDFVKFKENGDAYFGLADPEAIEALQWASDMLASPSIVVDGNWPPDLWAKSGAVFILGDGSFGTASSGSSAHWGLDNLEDLRCIPFPKGPKGDGSVGGAYSTDPSGTVMLFGVDKEDSGYVWSVRTDVSLETKEVNDEEWKRKTFFQDDPSDNDSYNNWVFVKDNFNYDYASQIGKQGMTDLKQALSNIMLGTTSPMQGVQSVQSMIQTSLDKSMNQK